MAVRERRPCGMSKKVIVLLTLRGHGEVRRILKIWIKCGM